MNSGSFLGKFDTHTHTHIHLNTQTHTKWHTDATYEKKNWV